MNLLGIRGRILLLVLAAALPALGVSIYSGLDRRSVDEADAHAELARLAVLVEKQQEQSIEGVHQLLFALAASSAELMKSPPACNRFFRGLLDASGDVYNTIGINGADGILMCAALPWSGKVDVSDRRYFRLAVARRAFAIGEYQLGRATGRPGLNFGYPVIDAQGSLRGVVFAGLNLAKLKELAAALSLPGGGTVTLFDYDGIVLAHHPDAETRSGDAPRNPAIIEAIRAGRDTIFDAPDVDGVPRFYAFRSVRRYQEDTPALHILVSLPKQVVLARANRSLQQSVTSIVVATLLLLIIAWFGTQTAILRKIETMLRVTQRVHDGDLAARTGYQPGADELSQLGSGLDEMTQALQDRNAQLQDVMRQLQEQATTDALTGLYNRRYLRDFLQRELTKAQRGKYTVAVIMLDLDHFKRINDTWGHDGGDAVLKAVAGVLKRGVRGSDLPCRYGGEEFMLVLPGATREAALQRAVAIREEIERTPLIHEGKSMGGVTASLGVAIYPAHGEDPESLGRAADAALYVAKNSGRNQVRLYAPGAKAGLPA